MKTKSILFAMLLAASLNSFADEGTKSFIENHDDWSSFILTFPSGDVRLRMRTISNLGSIFAIDEIPNEDGTCSENISVNSPVIQGIKRDVVYDGSGTITVDRFPAHKFTYEATITAKDQQGFYKVNRIEMFDKLIGELKTGISAEFMFMIEGQAATETFSLMGMRDAMTRGARTCEMFKQMLEQKKNQPTPAPTKELKV